MTWGAPQQPAAAPPEQQQQPPLLQRPESSKPAPIALGGGGMRVGMKLGGGLNLVKKKSAASLAGFGEVSDEDD